MAWCLYLGAQEGKQWTPLAAHGWGSCWPIFNHLFIKSVRKQCELPAKCLKWGSGRWQRTGKERKAIFNVQASCHRLTCKSRVRSGHHFHLIIVEFPVDIVDTWVSTNDRLLPSYPCVFAAELRQAQEFAVFRSINMCKSFQLQSGRIDEKCAMDDPFVSLHNRPWQIPNKTVLKICPIWKESWPEPHETCRTL